MIPYICDQLAMSRLPRGSFAVLLALLPATAPTDIAQTPTSSAERPAPDTRPTHAAATHDDAFVARPDHPVSEAGPIEPVPIAQAAPPTAGGDLC